MTTDRTANGPRVLVFSRQLPSPPRSGGALREIHIVRALAAIGPTYVYALAPAGPPPPDLELAGWEASSDPVASSIPQGAEFVAALRAGESPFHARVSEIAARELDVVVEKFSPHIVVIRGNELSGYIPQLRAHGARLILDSDYAYAAAWDEMGARDPNRARGLAWRRASHLAATREAVDVGLVDQIWVSNTESQNTLRTSYPEAAPVTVIPNVVDVASYPQSTRENPRSVLYMGRFDFWPNEEAAAILVRELLPLVEDASVSLVGTAPTSWMRAADDPRVTVTGTVDDVRPYLRQAGVLAVPLHAGSGTRLKVLEAFAASLPVVSTAKGIEGLHAVDGMHYLNAETVDEFAGAIELLARDPARATSLTVAAHALVEERFSLPTLELHIRSALAGLIPDHTRNPRPMRILFISPMYLPLMGGLEVLTAQILPELQARGHDVAVLTSHGGGTRPQSEVLDGIPVRRTDTHRAIESRDGAAILRVQRETWEFIKEFAPDVIHSHDAAPSLWLYLRLIRDRPRPPIVLTLHNVMSQQFNENSQGLPGLITLMGDVDWITGVSEDVVTDAFRIDPSVAGRISLIRNGVPRPPLSPTPVVDGPAHFLSIGRLVSQKGLDRAIGAVAALAPRYPDLTLTIIGVGPLLAALTEQAARLEITDRVTFAGRVEHADIPAHLSAATAVLMPSRYEGLPLVALEAAWMARPVVGTAAPGLSQAVVDDETGLLVDPADPDALAAALESLVVDRALARSLGDEALRRAEQEWSFAACVDAYEALYHRLVRSDARGGW